MRKGKGKVSNRKRQAPRQAPRDRRGEALVDAVHSVLRLQAIGQGPITEGALLAAAWESVRVMHHNGRTDDACAAARTLIMLRRPEQFRLPGVVSILAGLYHALPPALRSKV